MDQKFSIFLEIARVLNKHQIIPIIYGSLGLYHLIGKQLDEVDDIDIVVPNRYLTDKFDELKSIMTSIGYNQDRTFPHEFSKDTCQIGFEPESELQGLEINTHILETRELDEARFKQLRLSHYLKIYTKNLQMYELKVTKIKKKIGVVEKKLKELSTKDIKYY